MPSALLKEARSLRARYDEEPSHSDQVALLAMQMFDGLQSWHGLNTRSGELLHCAALLHDIGWSQTPDGKGHHKESARLIREYRWKNLPSVEREVVALVARYHRKVPPQPHHADFQALSVSGQRTVLVLGGILRVADALDRTHTGKIRRAWAAVSGDDLLVRVEPGGSWEEERATFAIKSDMLLLAGARSIRCEALR